MYTQSIQAQISIQSNDESKHPLSPLSGQQHDAVNLEDLSCTMQKFSAIEREVNVILRHPRSMLIFSY